MAAPGATAPRSASSTTRADAFHVSTSCSAGVPEDATTSRSGFAVASHSDDATSSVGRVSGTGTASERTMIGARTGVSSSASMRVRSARAALATAKYGRSSVGRSVVKPRNAATADGCANPTVSVEASSPHADEGRDCERGSPAFASRRHPNPLVRAGVRGGPRLVERHVDAASRTRPRRRRRTAGQTRRRPAPRGRTAGVRAAGRRCWDRARRRERAPPGRRRRSTGGRRPRRSRRRGRPSLRARAAPRPRSRRAPRRRAPARRGSMPARPSTRSSTMSSPPTSNGGRPPMELARSALYTRAAMNARRVRPSCGFESAIPRSSAPRT